MLPGVVFPKPVILDDDEVERISFGVEWEEEEEEGRETSRIEDGGTVRA